MDDRNYRYLTGGRSAAVTVNTLRLWCRNAKTQGPCARGRVGGAFGARCHSRMYNLTPNTICGSMAIDQVLTSVGRTLSSILLFGGMYGRIQKKVAIAVGTPRLQRALNHTNRGHWVPWNQRPTGSDRRVSVNRMILDKGIGAIISHSGYRSLKPVACCHGVCFLPNVDNMAEACGDGQFSSLIVIIPRSSEGMQIAECT